MLSFKWSDEWLTALDPDSPAWLVAWAREWVDAYSAGDLDWVIAHTHPELEIVQPPEFPDARTYRGVDGLIDALLDWPREWEDFAVEPTRIFALDDRAVVSAVHRGRSRRMEVEVEAEIVWLFAFEDGRTRRWDMFMSVEDALGAASS
jgi:ketosteroid isomerase-like protein